MFPDRTRRIVGLLLASMLLADAAAGLTYYVRTTGSDADTGLSPAQAWRTIEHAGDTLVAGDTVYIGAGTYTDKVDVQNSGTAVSPILFVADTTGFFTGDAGAVVLSDGGDVFKVDGEDYVQIIGLRTTGGNKGFKIKDATGIVLRDCEADGLGSEGVEIDKAVVEISGGAVQDND